MADDQHHTGDALDSVEELEELEELEEFEELEELGHADDPSPPPPHVTTGSNRIPSLSPLTTWDLVMQQANEPSPAQPPPDIRSPHEQRRVTPSGGLSFPHPFGKYTLLQKLATGGMAELFLALHTPVEGFEKLVVIKQILPHLSEDAEFIEMLLQEARIAAQLNHPNVVQIYDVGQEQGRYYIAMEYIRGEDLRAIAIQMKQQKVRRMPADCTTALALGLCAGLAYAHEKQGMDGASQHIVHRDVSPHNVLISYAGDVKIVDFGIAKSEQAAERATRTGAIKGKAPYMSPEQALGKPLDQRSDIFSTGIVLFEMVTGKRLFKADSQMETLRAIQERPVPSPELLVPDCPPELSRILLKSLEKAPENRYQTAREMLDDIERFVREQRIPATSTTLRSWMETLFTERLAQQQDKLHDLKKLADFIADSRRKTMAIADAPSFTDSPGENTFDPSMAASSSIPSLDLQPIAEAVEPESAAPSTTSERTGQPRTPHGGDHNLRCPKCHAPVAMSAVRCSYCGEVLEATATMSALRPTPELADDRAHLRRLDRTKPTATTEHKSGIPVIAWVALVAIIVASIMVWMGLRNRNAERAASSTLHAASPKPPAPPKTLVINGVEIGTSPTVDPSDLASAVRKTLHEPNTELRFGGLSVRGASGGKVNLHTDGAILTYRYSIHHLNPGPQAAPWQKTTITLSKTPPAPVVQQGQWPALGEPVCIWSAMWRAAVGAGLDPAKSYDIDFAPDKHRAGVWRVRDHGDNHVRYLLDGRTCVIKRQ